MTRTLRSIAVILQVGRLLALVPLAAACGSPSGAPGGAGPTVRIGLSMGLTGPAAAAVATMVQEFETTFKYINEVEGGIDGVKLEWKTVDHKGTPEGSIVAYKELRDSFKPAVFVTEADYYMAGAIDMINTDKSVVLSTSALNNKTVVPPGRFFSMTIPTADGFAAYVKNIMATWKGATKPKVGVLHWDLASGLQWRMAEGFVRSLGVELVAAPYSIAGVDLKPQLLTLRDAKVDFIWMMATTPNAAVAIRDFRGLGMAGKTPFTFAEMVEAQPLLGIVGDQAEGFMGYMPESPSSDKAEGAQLFTKIYKFAGKDNAWSDNRLMITLKAILTAAVKQAAADVGKDKIDGEAIHSALNKLSSIDTWGNVQGFGYGPGKRIGVSNIRLRQYTKTGTVAVGEWIPTPRVYEGVDK